MEFAMSLHAASYFAGVGTVVATMAIGFGGGVMLTDAFVGNSDRTPTLMERRAAPLSESTAPVIAAAPAPPVEQQVVAAPAPPQPRAQSQVQPQTSEQQSAAPQQAVAAPVAPAPTVAPQAAPQPVAVPAPQTATAPVAQDGSRFEQSMGRMRDTDLRNQEAEARKAATAERRKQERRKWAERRKRDMQKLDELTAVSEKVKQAEREREREPEPVFRSFAAERPAQPRLPVINLFGGGDDD
jgi:hypothetical protein